MNGRTGAFYLRRLGIIGSSIVISACGGTLDAGADKEGEKLPFGPKNPVIIVNDNVSDNWHGEYAALLTHVNGATLAGIVIGTGSEWLDLDANVLGWEEFVAVARDSGLSNVPNPIRSESAPLRRPADGDIDATVPNDSEGARFIVEVSAWLAQPERPVVVATGTRLTDVADAYLLDPSIADRIIVSASVGTFSEADGAGHMGVPNGENDPWADAIVLDRLPYVQVSARYDQLTDLPAERVSELPNNPLGDWMAAKQPGIFDIEMAADQVSVLAPGLPEFVTDFVRATQSGWQGDIPALGADPSGSAWVVTESDGEAATEGLWRLLLDGATFSN